MQLTYLFLGQFFTIWYSWRTTNAPCFQNGDQLILNDIYLLKSHFGKGNFTFVYKTQKDS